MNKHKILGLIAILFLYMSAVSATEISFVEESCGLNICEVRESYATDEEYCASIFPDNEYLQDICMELVITQCGPRDIPPPGESNIPEFNTIAAGLTLIGSALIISRKKIMG